MNSPRRIVRKKCEIIRCNSLKEKGVYSNFSYFENSVGHILCYQCYCEIEKRIKHTYSNVIEGWTGYNWSDYTIDSFIKGMNDDPDWPKVIKPSEPNSDPV